MAQRGRDVDAVVTLLPEADDGNLNAALDGGNVREALAADCCGTAQLAGAGNLGHGLRVPHGFSGIRLDAHDELALEGLDERIDSHGCSSPRGHHGRAILD